jgi:hypothetical protein
MRHVIFFCIIGMYYFQSCYVIFQSDDVMSCDSDTYNVMQCDTMLYHMPRNCIYIFQVNSLMNVHSYILR